MCVPESEKRARESMFVRATLIHHAGDVGKFKGTNNNGLRDLHERRGERGGKENERGQKGE